MTYIFHFISTAPGDYTSQNGLLTFDSVNIRREVTIPLTDDMTDEDQERFSALITLVSPGESSVMLQPNMTSIIIEDNDGT